MSQRIYRTTLFKLPLSTDRQILLEIYKALPEKAKKVSFHF